MRFLLLLISFAVYLSAVSVSNGCGYFNGNKFQAYSCPASPGNESTLQSINPKTGKITCTYRDGTTTKTNTYATNCGLGLQKNLNNSVINSAGETVSVVTAEILPDFGATSGDIFSTVDVRSKIKDTMETMKGLKATATLTNVGKVDSHTNKEGTVPAILTGVFTLDGDYFEKDGGQVQYINEVGEISINPDYIDISKDNSILASMGDAYNKVMSFFSGGGDVSSVSNYSTFNPVHFMDLQVLGFYVYLAENLIAGYMNIVYILFMTGLFAGTSFYAYKKFFQKTTGEDFRVNKMSYILASASAFIFFTAPVVVENVKTTGAISQAMYSDGALSTGASYGTSTLAQQSIRYAAQMGTYFGNLESDYAMQAYLAFLSFKQGMLQSPSSVEKSLEHKMNDLESKLITASFDANYVKTVCEPYFGVGYYKDDKQVSSNKQMTSGGDEAKAILQNAGINADRIDINDCNQKAKNVADAANAIVKQKKSIIEEVDKYEQLYSVSHGSTIIGANPQDKFADFMRMMKWTQDTFGWMASITPHTSYLFFKHVDAFVYDNEVAEPEKTTTNFSDASEEQTKSNPDGSDEPQKKSFIEEAFQATVGAVIQNSTWFVVPGFSNIYSFFQERFSSIVFKGGTGESTSLGSKIIIAIGGLTTVVGSALSSMDGDFSGVILGAIALIIGWAGDSYTAYQIIISIMSFFMAIAITLMMIQTITVLSVTVFIAFKIVMYFIELIIFFMSAPVVGIYATIMSDQPQTYIQNFIKHLGMLIVSPLMIVSASYLVLPITELFKGLFSALVTLLFKVFDKGEDLLNTDMVGTNVIDTMQKAIALSAMQGVAEIFAMFSTIIISYIIIFNYKGWFLKLVGLDNMADHTREAYGEMKQKSDKYIAPM